MSSPRNEAGNRARDATRRSDWLETRRRILDAARQLFGERGFRGTTTKDVAKVAGIAELTLYRHFSTKAQLFEEAAIEPINEFLRGWIRSWTGGRPGTKDTASEGIRFYETLMTLLAGERKLMAGVVASMLAEGDGSDVSPEARAVMSSLLDELEAVFAREGARRGYTSDPHITPRLIMAMSLGIAVHGDWLFGQERQPSHEELVRELANLTVFGLQGPPAGNRH